MNTFLTLLAQDCLIAFRQRAQLVNPLIFFIMVVSLFPLSVGAYPNLLAQIGPGVIWVAALLATVLGLEHLFRSDYDDGTLEQLLISPYPMYWVAFAKVLAHWMLAGLPLILLSPLLATLMQMNSDATWALMLSLLAGTPALSAVGSIGAALIVGVRRGGVLLSLIILPLYIPVLIFGSAAVVAGQSGLDYSGQIALLTSFSLAAVVLVPFAIAGALRASVN